MVTSVSQAPGARWLVLIHQIPPQPSYLRVKVGRRLQALGAVAVKNSVYVLPLSDQALEDFQWVRREIVSGGGDASVCEARFVEGLSDTSVESLFNAAREADYAALLVEARKLHVRATRKGKGKVTGTPKVQIEPALLKLRKRLSEIVDVDFFAASGRDTVEGLLAAIESSLRAPRTDLELNRTAPSELRGRTWVTRTGVHVDRMASAWLIRRFIDPEARFRFVGGQHRPGPGELRFDMFEGEFTHEGDLCTFEVLLRRFGLADPALVRVGEIIHDIDLKDARFERPETAGIDHLIAGIAMRHKDDDSRIRDGAAAFEALYEFFRRSRR
jgi:hypothetical protein